MTLTQHLWLGAPPAVLLALAVGPVPAGLFFAAAVLIDLDHWLVFRLATGKSSLPAMFRWYAAYGRLQGRYPRFHAGLFALHTVEAFVLLLCLSWVVPWAGWLFLGCCWHLACDRFGSRLAPDRTRAWSTLAHLLGRVAAGPR